MIIDNINTKLEDDIQSEFLQLAADHNPHISACICTGYFSLWGWDKLKHFFFGASDSFSEHWDIKLIIGMEKDKQEFIQRFNPSNSVVNQKLANSFKEAIRTGGMQVKYALKSNIHAKMYAFDLNNTSVAYVGSSNFTHNGLSSSIELMFKIKEKPVIQQLKDWFNTLWDNENLVDISDEIAWGEETHHDSSLLDFTMIEKYCFAVKDFKVYTESSSGQDYSNLYDNSKCYRTKDYLDDCDGLNKTLLSELIMEHGLPNLYFDEDGKFNDSYLEEHLDLRGMDLLAAAKFCKKSANSNYIYEQHLYDLMDGYINDYD